MIKLLFTGDVTEIRAVEIVAESLHLLRWLNSIFEVDSSKFFGGFYRDFMEFSEACVIRASAGI
jgi:hypothetical protein